MTKRKVISLVAALLVALSVQGCSKGNSTASTSNNTDTKNNTKQEEPKKQLNTQTLDGLTLTVTSKIQPIKGDRTKDNVGDANGEYFANGSDIVKASDYKQIIATIDIKNDTNKTVQVGPLYWNAQLQDDYNLTDTVLNNSDTQVQSHATGEYKLNYIVKNSIKTEKIKISYLWVKNQEEFTKLMTNPNSPKMTEQEAAVKYKDVYSSIKLETDIQR